MTGSRKGTGVQIGRLMGGSGEATAARVLEFLRQGQRAQAAVERILAAERKRRPRPKGRA